MRTEKLAEVNRNQLEKTGRKTTIAVFAIYQQRKDFFS